jgi:PKHD-type hydroxylase
MKALWQLWSRSLSDETVSNIIKECEQYPSHQATIGTNNSIPNSEYRKSEIKWVNKHNNSSKWIADLIFNYAQTANRNAFGFNIDYINDIQYTIYHSEDNGKYDWHCDTFWDSQIPYDRKISVVIQLSDPNEYEGGKFELDYQYPQPNIEDLNPKGSVFVFPSFLSHRVTPVTSGTRRSLVSWVEGPSFR